MDVDGDDRLARESLEINGAVQAAGAVGVDRNVKALSGLIDVDPVV